MSENSKIEWTDHTFNPWIGCTKVSPGCDHCYAERDMAGRLKVVQWGPHGERLRTKPANWAKPLAWNRRHDEFFAQHGRRQRVFCASEPVAAVAPSDVKGNALEYRTCCEHPDCATCAGRGGFYRVGAKGKADAADLLNALQKAARLLRAAGFCMNGTATSQIMAAIKAAPGPRAVYMDRETMWKIYGIVKGAAHHDLARTISDAISAEVDAFLGQSPTDSSPATSAADAKDAWIDVKDRLPEPWDGRLFSKSVLIVDMDSRYPHVRMSELNFEEYEGKVVPTVWSGADPTHWQPAPALPAAMAAAPSSEKGGAQQAPTVDDSEGGHHD